MSWAHFSGGIALGVLFAPACFHPNFNDQTVCSSNGECPSGRRCSPQRTCEVDSGLDASIPDASTAFQSCTGLPSNCGGVSGTDDCCQSLPVDGGKYYRSYDVNTQMQIIPDLTTLASVNNFRLDKYEVTVGRFRAFVKAGQGTQINPPANGAGAHANVPGSGWDAAWNMYLPADAREQDKELQCSPTFQIWIDSTGSNETRPMNCVSWYEAMAFCIWDGGYLPTEAEWVYAAAGGKQQRLYPWSMPPGAKMVDALDASYAPSTDSGQCIGAGSSPHDCTSTDLLPVGSKPHGDGPYGHSDLGGNVEEWVLDWYVTPYPHSSPPDYCMDCAATTEGPTPKRVQRGGGFDDDENAMLATTRIPAEDPTMRHGDLGFRCARAR